MARLLKIKRLTLRKKSAKTLVVSYPEENMGVGLSEKLEKLANLLKPESSVEVKILLQDIIFTVWERYNHLENHKADREELKAVLQEFKSGFQIMNARFEALLREMDSHFKAMNERFVAMENRFEGLLREMNARFEAMDERFRAQQQQFRFMQWFVVGAFTLLSLIISASHFYLAKYLAAILNNL